MIWLIAGLVLWYGAHLFKRWAPGPRAALQERIGDASKGLFALAIFAAVALMVLGYRAAGFVPVWQPPGFLTHLNNLLMLLAFYVYGAGGPKGARVWLGTKLRHPQLTGFMIWAVAHLLVNGDLAALLLFGGLLLWAGLEIAVINRSDGAWTAPARAAPRKEVVLIGITLVLYGVVSGIHIWLGRWPFGG